MRELNQLLLNFDQKKILINMIIMFDSNYFAFNLIDKWPKWEKNILKYLW